MSKLPDTEDEEFVYFTVPVRLSVVGLLMDFAETCQDDPARIIGSIAHDVLIDDARQHGRTVEGQSNKIH